MRQLPVTFCKATVQIDLPSLNRLLLYLKVKYDVSAISRDIDMP
jgi:hypothetical protein